MDEIAAKLRESLDQGVSDDAMNAIRKKVEDITCYIEDDVMYRLKNDLADCLSRYAVDMAEQTIKSILDGNEDQMRHYLSCKPGYWNGRDKNHSVIHGTLFETGCLQLRKRLVDAHKDILTSERILDLEDQVKSLVIQINKLERDKEELFERLRV